MRSPNHTTSTWDTNAKANSRIDEVENGLNGGKETEEKPGAWLPALHNPPTSYPTPSLFKRVRGVRFSPSTTHLRRPHPLALQTSAGHLFSPPTAPPQPTHVVPHPLALQTSVGWSVFALHDPPPPAPP